MTLPIWVEKDMSWYANDILKVRQRGNARVGAVLRPTAWPGARDATSWAFASAPMEVTLG